MTMNIKLYLIAALFFAGLCLTACASIEKNTLEQGSEYSLSISHREITASLDKIDDYETGEIYFTLAAETDCMTINAEAEISGKNQPVKTYFIAEKRIDISGFRDTKENTFIEIGKNFTHLWERNAELNICSEPGFPLKKLDSGPLYRLRFTAFRKEKLNYKFNIKSQAGVIFASKKEAL